MPVSKISLQETKTFTRGEFSGNVYIPTEAGRGFNALLVRVHGRHYRTRMKNAVRVYFVVEGEGSFTIGEQKESVQKGDLYLISDGEEYEYEGKMLLFEFNVPGTDASHEEQLD